MRITKFLMKAFITLCLLAVLCSLKPIDAENSTDAENELDLSLSYIHEKMLWIEWTDNINATNDQEDGGYSCYLDGIRYVRKLQTAVSREMNECLKENVENISHKLNCTDRLWINGNGLLNALGRITIQCPYRKSKFDACIISEAKRLRFPIDFFEQRYLSCLQQRTAVLMEATDHALLCLANIHSQTLSKIKNWTAFNDHCKFSAE
uniref:Venom protein n=1 Tax=Ampulex compressa TaxID=860918 RepID=A0A1W6EVY7_AMPCP|nr:venom protein [Ampulex compressa]